MIRGSDRESIRDLPNPSELSDGVGYECFGGAKMALYTSAHFEFCAPLSCCSSHNKRLCAVVVDGLSRSEATMDGGPKPYLKIVFFSTNKLTRSISYPSDSSSSSGGTAESRSAATQISSSSVVNPSVSPCVCPPSWVVDVALDPLVVVMPKGGGDVGEASRFDAPVTDTNEPRLMLKIFNFPFRNFVTKD